MPGLAAAGDRAEASAQARLHESALWSDPPFPGSAQAVLDWLVTSSR
jgi:hypothetical protein